MTGESTFSDMDPDEQAWMMVIAALGIGGFVGFVVPYVLSILQGWF